jgi:hypothetical protein
MRQLPNQDQYPNVSLSSLISPIMQMSGYGTQEPSTRLIKRDRLILNFQESGHPVSINIGVDRALALEFFQLVLVELPPDSAPLSSV